MNVTRRCIRDLFKDDHRPSKAKPTEIPKSIMMVRPASRLFGEPQLRNYYTKPQNHYKPQTDYYVPFPLITKSKSRFIDSREEDDNQSEDDPFPEDDLPEDCKKMMVKFNSTPDIQLLRLVLIVAALVCSLTINVLKRRYFFDLDWELLVLVLVFGRLVSGWAIRVMVFSIGRNFSSRKRVLYFVYCLRNELQTCVWLALVVLIVRGSTFDEKKNKIMAHATRILFCLLVGMSIWVLKTLLVKVSTMSFYASRFLDRMRESLLDQCVIEKLSGCQQVLEGELNGITIDHISRLNHRNISAWIMKNLMNIVTNGLLSSALDEKLHEGGDAIVKITSENQATDIAHEIIRKIAKPRCGYLDHEDLIRFLGEDEALITTRLLEDGRKQEKIELEEDRNEPIISIADFRSWVVNAFRERRALVLSLNDTKIAVNKVDQMLNVLVGVVVVLAWIFIFEVATIYLLVILSFQFFLVFFAFGNTCKLTFRAMVFFFVVHPFDVGDRVEVDGKQMMVERMHILTTVFLKYDNGEKIYYPNIDLTKKPIKNFRRSPRKKNVLGYSY